MIPVGSSTGSGHRITPPSEFTTATTSMTLLWLMAALAAAWLLAIAALYLGGRNGVARELVELVPNLLRLFRGLLRDPRVPRSSKFLLAVAVVWIASPVDLIPEFIPVVGPLDDAIVAALVVRHLLKTAGHAVLAEHWRGSAATLDALARLCGGASGRR